MTTKKLIIDGVYEYEIDKAYGDGLQGYGYNLKVYKNNKCIYSQGGFGSMSTAQGTARDIFLMYEFNIERNGDGN